ncbi:MAG: AAA family ATPase [gamma proteobacterium symbiont of Bathyaustriella thionipta]|nr:AAA family ATPase [gamma proteobacterium symbiont of Bathyaustriella thionipta]
MIISQLSAENVLKYRSLELTDLPADGVIAISGQNESGKSSIGETVCFALFGRTFSIDEDDVHKVIRWGESRCSVHLKFISGDSEYEISRFLDNEGNSGVRLSRAGEDKPLAKGDIAVSEILYDILGYQFEEFVESFYLAQREITTPHPHSHAVKTMAGISSLEWVAEELQDDVAAEQDRVAIIQQEIDSVSADIDALELQEGHLDGLREQFQAVCGAEEALHKRHNQLETGLRDYQTALPRLKSARSRKRFSGFLAFLTLIFSALCGAGWYILVRMAGSQQADQLQGLINQYAHWWQDDYIARLPIVAGVAGVVFVVLWLSSRIIAAAMQNVRIAGEELADRLQQVQAAVPAAAQAEASSPGDASASEEPAEDDSTDSDADSKEEDSASETDEKTISAAATVADEAAPVFAEAAETALTPTSSIADAEIRQVRDCRMCSEDASILVSEALHVLREELHSAQEQHVRLQQAISNEEQRVAQADSMRAVIAGFVEKMSQHERKIDLNQLAEELLTGASRHMSQRFNRDLRDLVSRTLPLFTENRYEHLQIDEGLNVRVFSNEKRDFMDLDEISSGTQRQIMLAVRLALSQELVNIAVQGQQFVFLDEPFAFFDQERTRNSMSVLPELSDEIKQVWVIAQEFPEGSQFDQLIECSRDYECLPPANA